MSGLLVVGSLSIIHSAAAAPPPDWILGSPPSARGSWDYVARVDHTTAYDGSASGLLESIAKPVSRFGTLAQRVAGKVFAGKRIRFSAYIKTRNVLGIAGLWIRAEDASGRVIAFKNVRSPGSSVRGTREWTQVHIAISIPKATAAVFYGVLLAGPGAIWIDNVRFEVLGKADPDAPGPMFATHNPPPISSRLLPRPENLNFEK